MPLQRAEKGLHCALQVYKKGKTMFLNFGCRKEQSKETHVEIEAVEEADGE